MRLPCLQRLLVDVNGIRASDWFYSIGCFVSTLAVTNSAVALICFCLDFQTDGPIYHSLPLVLNPLLYILCLVCTIAAGLPPLVLSLMAILGIQYEQHGWMARLCGLEKFENFYCGGCATRYLLLATLSSAGVILFNTLQVGVLSHSVGNLFETLWATDKIASIHSLQRHYRCCGLDSFTDWMKLADRVPVSCNASTVASKPESSWLRGNQSPGVQQQVLVYKGGCASPLLSEQAIVCGIGNMLAFAGVLLLVAAWTRVERVAEISAQELRSRTFNHPRYVGEDAQDTFLDRRQKPCLSTPKYINHTSSTGHASASPHSDTSSGGAAVYKVTTRLQLSRGYLHQDGPSQEPVPRNSSSESNGNANNSALGYYGPWVSARVLNCIDQEIALRRAWDAACVHDGDSVRQVDELGRGGSPRQPLDAGHLLEREPGGDIDSCTGPRRRNRVVVRYVTRRQPLLLTDLLAPGCNRRRLPDPVKTVSSAYLHSPDDH